MTFLKRLFGRAPQQEPAAPVPTGPTALYNVYCTCLDIPQPTFAHILHARRDLADPELFPHLDGCCGYVLQRGDGQMTADKYHVITHLQRSRHQVSISVGNDERAAFHAWAKQANGLIVTEDGHVRDPSGRVLVDADSGKPEALARVPYLESAWARKAASEAALKARGIEVLASLPPVVAEEELVLRERDEVVGRARALLLVALRAESVAAGEPMSVDTLLNKMPLADEYLSSAERAFLAQEAPSQQACAQFLWRYESLAVLELALGLTDALPFPDAPSDSAALVAALIEMRGPALRPAHEILDALDLTYRLHWHIRQQRLKKKGEAVGVDADVVMERHHTLNWLVQFQFAPWDDVDTPT
ncbi:MAG: DUF4272 domain-containing protein [Gammaproteobacteria bacterium]